MARAARRLLRWMASATSSLPVPLSPVISTDASVGATRPTSCRMRSIRGSLPDQIAEIELRVELFAARRPLVRGRAR